MTSGRVDVAVIGAGIVGAATAWHCLERGLSVTLVDDAATVGKASYGNAGVISRGSIFPLVGPGARANFWRYALNRDIGLRIDYAALPGLWSWLVHAARRSDEASWRAAAGALNPLCAAAYDEHWRLAGEIGASDMIAQRGWLKLYRSQAAYEGTVLEREALAEHGVRTETIDGPELRQFEPGLTRHFAKGLWFPDTGAVDDPGGLVERIVAACLTRGARLISARATAIEDLAVGARVVAPGLTIEAETVVIAAGAAADVLTRRLGYRLPLAAERGYHRHFTDKGERRLTRPIHDTGGGYVVSPTRQGLRLLSGVELARREAAPNPIQIAAVEHDARATVALGDRIETDAWMGSRPSTPDGLPIIGRAPRHPNIVFAFGHGHIGLSTGPITGRIVADIVQDRTPPVPLAAFGAERFE